MTTSRSESLAFIAGAKTTETSLEIDDGFTQEKWEEIGARLAQVHKASRWWLGDWLISAMVEYHGSGFGHIAEDIYTAASRITGLTPDTLQNYVSICRRVHPEQRRPELTFAHHDAVAALPEEEQDAWLQKAVDSAWNSRELRTEVYGVEGKKQTLKSFATEVVQNARPGLNDVYEVPSEAMESLAEHLRLRLHARVIELHAERESLLRRILR
jgi:hypothetical protein